MRRLVVIVAALVVSAGAAGPAAAQLTERTLLMPGVTYERQVEFTLHGPVVLHVITAPRPDGKLYRLQPTLSNGAVVATEPLTSIERSLSGAATVAGVNGDYFNPNPGDPKGILMQHGVLMSPPPNGRSSAGISPDGSLQVARVSFNGIWKGNGQRRPLTLNEPPSGGSVTLYTPAWGPTTPPETGPVVEDVIQTLPPARPNTDLSGTVSQAVATGGAAIPPGGAVLVARGNQAPILQREAPVGQSLFLRLTLTPDWSGLAGAIGGGPVIVANGKPVFRAHEQFGAPLLNRRTSRSAVGQLADGRIVLVTTDGGGNGYSVGMTNFELALALIRLGAVDGMALGSGAAATMAFDGSLLNRPASRVEPEVSDALLLLYDGVYAPAPATTVLSPNGDGVDDAIALAYKVVRPSAVTAAVVGPGGVRQVLESGSVQPGTHSFSFTGRGDGGAALPEGGYRFTVTATDDLGRTTTAERGFALNDTLGALAVSPSTAQLSPRDRSAVAVTFELSRPADVDVVIATKTGVVTRTVFSGTLPAGPQRLTWDGRDSSGRLAFGGAYVARVAAANSVGHVELEQPFRTVRG